MAPLISNISEIISFLDTQAEIINEKNHLQIHRFESLKNSQEGDMTILYVSDLLKKYNIKITRLARGIPVGSSLEYIDDDCIL